MYLRKSANSGRLVINVAFDARPPCDADYHGVRRLLQQLFVKQINDELSELANLIVAQNFVGCVLKQDNGKDSDEEDSDESDDDDDDDDNVFAVNTVINISQQQNLSCIERIISLLKTTCQANHSGDPSRMTKLLDDTSKQIGLLISERFINIPPQVALPSYKSLKSDMERAVRKKRKFDFSHLVLISKTYRAKGEGQMGSEIFYSNAEEQLFSDMCEFSFTYSVADQRDGVSDGQWDDEGGDFESLRTVMVFDASALGHMIDKLESEVPST
ncbi:protein BCCIP homolog [Elysia marginata]|uniref:Protein BCCIP homolog n=1 Tax=Elysia marginata TaxID=1093978 RepID=A0AAV4IGI1_9GAST|nr:protein BCCIP homolog [Elysia marginata]